MSSSPATQRATCHTWPVWWVSTIRQSVGGARDPVSGSAAAPAAGDQLAARVRGRARLHDRRSHLRGPGRLPGRQRRRAHPASTASTTRRSRCRRPATATSAVKPGARLSNTCLVTPLRVLFLIILVGTTLEVLTEQDRTRLGLNAVEENREGPRHRCGYGTKGRGASPPCWRTGSTSRRIVVVDRQPGGGAAGQPGRTGRVEGSATRSTVLNGARCETPRRSSSRPTATTRGAGRADRPAAHRGRTRSSSRPVRRRTRRCCRPVRRPPRHRLLRHRRPAAGPVHDLRRRSSRSSRISSPPGQGMALAMRSARSATRLARPRRGSWTELVIARPAGARCCIARRPRGGYDDPDRRHGRLRA